MPIQGSTHFWLTHALFLSQSSFITHSGRHSTYGSPLYSGKQLHEPALLRSLQTAFAPHGDGLHGSRISGSIETINKYQRSIKTSKDKTEIFYNANEEIVSYLGQECKPKMDHRYIHLDNDNLLDDSIQYKLHMIHKLRYMDLCIVDLYKPTLGRIHPIPYIPVDTLAVCQCNLEDMNKRRHHHVLDNLKNFHTVLEHMDWMELQ